MRMSVTQIFAKVLFRLLTVKAVKAFSACGLCTDLASCDSFGHYRYRLGATVGAVIQ